MAKERVIDSGISVKHARSWTISEAMREVVQNYLDALAEYHCDGRLGYDEIQGCANIADCGPGMKVEHLAFGNNDKASDSIGQFGEGLKSALVTLVRENVRTEINSNGLIMRPFFKMSENFGVDTLHYEISKGDEVMGTHIWVWCSKEDFEKGKNYFTKLDENFEWIDEGKVSVPGNGIYVNGSKIGALEHSIFSYHLRGDDAVRAMNRDRNAVDMNIVSPIIREMLNRTECVKVAETILRRMTVDFNGEEFFENTIGLYSYNDKVWLDAWHKIYSDKWVLPSNSLPANNAVEYRGFHLLNNVSYGVARFIESFGVKSAARVMEEVSKNKKEMITRIPFNSLTKEEKRNLLWAKKAVEAYYCDPGKVIVGENIELVVGMVGDGRAAGCHDQKTETTYVARCILDDRKTLLHTLLHETVHAVSHEDDLTSEFEHALLAVSVDLIMGGRETL